MSKRANGEGSLHRYKARWVGVLTVGWEGGRQKRRTVSGKTRAEAREKLLRLQAQIAVGLPLPDDQLTVGVWLERWMADRVEGRLAPKTVTSYRHVVDAHLGPDWALGKVKLTSLTPARVQQLLDDLVDRDVRPPSVKYALDILRIALRAAQLADLIQRENPASVVKAPTFRRRKAQPFTALEAQAFLASVREDRLHALFALGMTAALRRGELLGLQWGDIDTGRRRILLARQLQRQKGKGLVTRQVKSDRSEAPVVLTALAVRALQAHRARLTEDRLARGPEWQGSDDPGAPGAFVFVSETGTPMDPDNVGRRYKALLIDAGLPAHRMHDMRHTTATLLHALGVPAAVARDVLRHTDIKTTLGIYTASDEAAQLRAADGLDDLLGGVLG